MTTPNYSVIPGPMRKLSDMPDLPLVEFVVALDGAWGTWCWSDTPDFDWNNSVAPLFPPDTPWKLIHKKMARLIERGIIEGCPCPCRGDYEMTEASLRFLAEESAKPGAVRCPPEMIARAQQRAIERNTRFRELGLLN
jgi:hypothetical protein